MFPSSTPFPSLEPAAAPATVGREHVVLLVEDEASLSDLLTHLLSRLNITVLCARDGAEALKFFAEQPDRISLAFVDCHLPDVKGGDLCHNLRAVVPNLPVLLTSGRDQRALEQALAAGGPCGFLAKPYMPGEVIRRVSALLSNAA